MPCWSSCCSRASLAARKAAVSCMHSASPWACSRSLSSTGSSCLAASCTVQLSILKLYHRMAVYLLIGAHLNLPDLAALHVVPLACLHGGCAGTKRGCLPLPAQHNFVRSA